MESIRHKISNKVAPFNLQTSLPEDLTEIISRCWLLPSLRPLSRTIADTLLQFQLRITSNITVYAALDYSGVDISTNDVEKVRLKKSQNLALRLIHKARETKESADIPREKLDPEDADILMQYAEHPLYPECAFLVGAAIWWGLLDIWLVKRFIAHQAKTSNGGNLRHSFLYFLS